MVAMLHNGLQMILLVFISLYQRAIVEATGHNSHGQREVSRHGGIEKIPEVKTVEKAAFSGKAPLMRAESAMQIRTQAQHEVLAAAPVEPMSSEGVGPLAAIPSEPLVMNRSATQLSPTVIAGASSVNSQATPSVATVATQAVSSAPAVATLATPAVAPAPVVATLATPAVSSAPAMAMTKVVEAVAQVQSAAIKTNPDEHNHGDWTTAAPGSGSTAPWQGETEAAKVAAQANSSTSGVPVTKKSEEDPSPTPAPSHGSRCLPSAIVAAWMSWIQFY